MSDLSLKYLLFGEDKTASKAIKGVADTAEQSSGRMSGASKLMAAGAVAAGAALVAFGKDSVGAFVEADQQQRVLEDAYRRFPAIADVSIDAMREQAAALQNKTKFDGDAINSMQGVLAQYKLTGTEIQQLTPLILDYAEKTGKSLPDASAVVGKALMGQGRALKEVGINFKDTGTKTGNLTQLMTGLRTQVGGFAEQEGKSAEGRAEILKNKFGDLQENIGEKLLPAIEFTVTGLGNIVDVGGQVIGVVGDIPAPILTAVGAFTALHLLRGPLGAFAGGVAGKMRPLGDSIRLAGMYARDAGGGFTGMRAGLGALTGGLGAGQTAMRGFKAVGSGLMSLAGGPWGLAIMGVTMAVTGFIQAQKNAEAAAKALADTMDRQAGSFTDASRKTVVQALLGDLSPEDVKMLQDLGISLGEGADAALKGGAALEAYNAKVMAATENNRDAWGAASGYTSSLQNQAEVAHDATTVNAILAREGIKPVGEAADTAAGSGDLFAGVVGAVGSAADGAKVDMQGVNDELAEFQKLTMSARGAARDYEAAVDDASASVKENGKTLNIHTEAGRKNQAALDHIAESALDVAEADIKAGKSTGDVTAKVKLANDAFVAAAVKMGMKEGKARTLAKQLGLTSGKVQELINKENGIPAAKTTKVTVPTATAVRQAQTIRDEIRNIRGKNVPINLTVGARFTGAAMDIVNAVGSIGSAFQFGTNAHGTASWRGGLTWVGERGPELVDLPSGSQIYDANTSAAMSSSSSQGGGALQPVIVQFVSPDGRVIQQQLLQLKRQTGGSLGLA